MEKKVKQKTVASSRQSGLRREPFDTRTMKALRQRPLRQKVEGAMLDAAAHAIHRVMKDDGFDLEPMEASLMAIFWAFDRNIVWDFLKAQNAIPACGDN